MGVSGGIGPGGRLTSTHEGRGDDREHCQLQWRKSLWATAIASGWSWSGVSLAAFPHSCCIPWGGWSIWISAWHGTRSSPSSYSSSYLMPSTSSIWSSSIACCVPATMKCGTQMRAARVDPAHYQQQRPPSIQPTEAYRPQHVKTCMLIGLHLVSVTRTLSPSTTTTQCPPLPRHCQQWCFPHPHPPYSQLTALLQLPQQGVPPEGALPNAKMPWVCWETACSHLSTPLTISLLTWRPM